MCRPGRYSKARLPRGSLVVCPADAMYHFRSRLRMTKLATDTENIQQIRMLTGQTVDPGSQLD